MFLKKNFLLFCRINSEFVGFNHDFIYSILFALVKENILFYNFYLFQLSAIYITPKGM